MCVKGCSSENNGSGSEPTRPKTRMRGRVKEEERGAGRYATSTTHGKITEDVRRKHDKTLPTLQPHIFIHTSVADCVRTTVANSYASVDRRAHVRLVFCGSISNRKCKGTKLRVALARIRDRRSRGKGQRYRPKAKHTALTSRR